MKIPANIILMKMIIKVDDFSVMKQKVQYTIILSSSNLKEDKILFGLQGDSNNRKLSNG